MSMGRNPHASIDREPLTRQQVSELRDRVERFWEDYWLVTEPNKYRVIEIGNLKALCDTLLQCKDFDNPQLMLGEVE